MNSNANWVKGQRGFQPSLGDNQQLEMLKVWLANNWKNQPVRDHLKARYNIELKPRTFNGYKKRLRDRYKEMSSNVDEFADWSDFVALERNGVPSRYLGGLHAWWSGIQKICVAQGSTAIEPTYRELKWWAFVLEYHLGSLDSPVDMQLVAGHYASREMLSEVFKKDKADNEDLDMWLLYKPWESEEKMSEYKRLVELGTIPAIDWSKCEIDMKQISRDRLGFQPDDIRLDIMCRFLAHSPEPYILPSEMMKKYLPVMADRYKKIKESNQKEVKSSQ